VEGGRKNRLLAWQAWALVMGYRVIILGWPILYYLISIYKKVCLLPRIKTAKRQCREEHGIICDSRMKNRALSGFHCRSSAALPRRHRSATMCITPSVHN
jgi:hypothetical protein